ncbi:rCG24361 [Rattus norvegicus]|uniref:RCG24361 n=1 Tax=Rattus norvegicus TaxID=10116 RepID=A6K593_RAT|nr:rCG24361 [Rattus norvegicus]
MCGQRLKSLELHLPDVFAVMAMQVTDTEGGSTLHCRSSVCPCCLTRTGRG